MCGYYSQGGYGYESYAGYGICLGFVKYFGGYGF